MRPLPFFVPSFQPPSHSAMYVPATNRCIAVMAERGAF